MRPSSPDPATPPQVIPRPPVARLGGPPPWADVDPGRRRGLTVERALAQLERAGWTGPEPPAGKAAMEVLDGPLAARPIRQSAVLVGLFEEAGEARVILTRRAATLRSHRGEVSFPGGGIEAGEGPVRAALREASEEVALDPATVRPVGWLRPVITYVSNSLVVPVVGVVDPPPERLVPSPDEVDRVFEGVLADLVADGAFHEEWWSVPGRRGLGPDGAGTADGAYPIRFFQVAGETVWGATGRMLYELLCVVLGSDPADV